MWRAARPEDDEVVVDMCLALNREDPGPRPLVPEQIRRTLTVLRREPSRGLAVVAEQDGQLIGYALLIAFWSNELGGEVCEIDEIYVVPEQRNNGYGRELFAALERGELWPKLPVALALGTTPDNERARRLYESLGFRAIGISMVRRLNH
jgi:GNAT superfamily N-acetyltransferase